jgi:hypothetical protein
MKTHLSVCAVFDSRFNDEIRIGIFLVVFPDDEVSVAGNCCWLNWTELRDRIIKPWFEWFEWFEWLAVPCILFRNIERDFAYSKSSYSVVVCGASLRVILLLCTESFEHCG